MSLRNVQLTPELVQAVRDAVDIVDIAGDYTKLRKAGRRHGGLCPLHKEKTPSFSVDPDQGLFYCFGCGQGGDAIRLHMLLSGDDFPAAIESLARRYGIPLPKRAPRRRDGRQEPDLEPVLEAAEAFFSERLSRAAGPREYLRRREIPDELVERFRLGYAPDAWRELLGELTPRFSVQELQAAGLAAHSERSGKPYDRFRNRLMFPIRNAAGRLLGFGGRTLGDDRAKYINTAETSRFRKGTILYGLDTAKRPIREAGRAFLVEGYFDVLGAVAAGVDGTVASMGTALTPEQCRLLSRFADEVVIGYDGDAAGEEAARRALPLLLKHRLGVTRPAFGADHDPDSFRLAEGAERLVELVRSAPDMVSSEIDRLVPRGTASDPQRQAAAGRSVVGLLRPIPDGILRFGYARLAAQRLGVPVDMLVRRLQGEAESEPETAAQRAEGVVRSAEQRAVHLLLAGDGLPPVEELPPAEAFLDPECRNIYRAFCALYRDEGTAAPDAQAILARLDGGGEAVDQVARILLEGSIAAGPGDLNESLRLIKRRWQQQRLRELSAEIGDAQRQGDGERLQQLIEEKTKLSQRIHGASPETGEPGETKP